MHQKIFLHVIEHKEDYRKIDEKGDVIDEEDEMVNCRICSIIFTKCL